MDVAYWYVNWLALHTGNMIITIANLIIAGQRAASQRREATR